MPTTPDDIRRWLAEARVRGATHMVVACDTFDYEDYPVYVMPGQSVQQSITDHNDPNQMQRVMEVYAMHLDLDAQLREHRAWHLESPPPLPQEVEEVYEHEPAPRRPRREPVLVTMPSVLNRVIAQVRAEETERVTLGKKVLDLVAREPWLTATMIAKKLKAKPGSVSGILLKLTAGDDGPLVREKRGPRGGFGYALRPGPRASRYDLLNLEDWL